MVTDLNKIKTCTDCGSDNIFHKKTSNQIVCKDCGLIYEPLTPKEEEKFEKSHDLQ